MFSTFLKYFREYNGRGAGFPEGLAAGGSYQGQAGVKSARPGAPVVINADLPSKG
jgi:hypothetical protein